MPPSEGSTSVRPAAKYSSVLKTPVDTKLIDLQRAADWLATYLRKECPPHDELIATILMRHMGGHRMPDPKVAQVDLTQAALVPPDKIQRLMRKFWDMLLTEQADYIERNASVYISGQKLPSKEDEPAQKGRTYKEPSPPVRKASPRSDRGHDPKRIKLDKRHAPKVSEGCGWEHEQQPPSRRLPGTSSAEYYTSMAQHPATSHQPRSVSVTSSSGYSRSYFA